MLRTYCDLSPNSDTSQNRLLSNWPPIGVRRGRPDFLPMVSKKVWVGTEPINGFAKRRWMELMVRCRRVKAMASFKQQRFHAHLVNQSVYGHAAAWCSLVNHRHVAVALQRRL